MTTGRLSETVSVVLGAAGGGIVRVGPLSARETWTPSAVAVSVSSHTAEAACKLYVGDQPVQSNFVDGTYSGSSGDSTDSLAAQRVKAGEYVWAVWTGGDPGATATMTVSGSREI